MKATRRKKAKTKFELVRVGNIGVKVYTRTRRTATGKRTVFEVADYTAGRRRLRGFSDKAKAKDEAKRIAGLLSTGQATAAQFGAADAAAYGRSLELLRPTGTPIELAAAHYAEAFRILGGDKLVKAAHFYVKASLDKLEPRTVAEVVAELLASKEGRREKNTVDDLRARLTTFADAFQVEIASVTTPDVQRWLDGLKVSERHRFNFWSKANQLFRFAERRGYIPKHSNPVADTERPEPKRSAVTIYTPAEIVRLLNAAAEDFLPCIALGAFAGLRASEIQRLNWSDVNLARGFIMASAMKRGTPSRRRVDILPNLRQWLEPYANRTGLVWKDTEEHFSDAQQETIAKANENDKQPALKWKHNALRHSFISCRLAELQDAARVALEAGNSASEIHKSYREPVAKEDAKAWFAVVPERPKNVVSMGRRTG
jgi:integrase